MGSRSDQSQGKNPDKRKCVEHGHEFILKAVSERSRRHDRRRERVENKWHLCLSPGLGVHLVYSTNLSDSRYHHDLLDDCPISTDQQPKSLDFGGRKRIVKPSVVERARRLLVELIP